MPKKPRDIPNDAQSEYLDAEIDGNIVEIRIGRDRYEKVHKADYPGMRAAMITQGWTFPGCPPDSRVYKPKGAEFYSYSFRLDDKPYSGLTRKKTEEAAKDYLWEKWEETLSKVGTPAEHSISTRVEMLEQARDRSKAGKREQKSREEPRGTERRTHLTIKQISQATGLTTRTLYDMSYKRDLKSVKVRGKVLVPVGEFKRVFGVAWDDVDTGKE